MAATKRAEKQAVAAAPGNALMQRPVGPPEEKLEGLSRALSRPRDASELHAAAKVVGQLYQNRDGNDQRRSLEVQMLKLKANEALRRLEAGSLSFAPAEPPPKPAQKHEGKITAGIARSSKKILVREKKAKALAGKKKKVAVPSRTYYPPTPAVRATTPKSEPRHPPPAKRKAPEKLAYIVEYEEMMAKFRNLAKNLTMPTPTAAAQESKARSEAAMRKLEAEFDAWQQKYPPQQFPWPKLVGGAGTGAMDYAMADQSPLSVLGYKVGKTAGLPEDERLRILDYAFANRLPPIESPAYMVEWGPPRTPDRLRRMAEHLAQTHKMFRSRNASMYGVALSHWNADLAYLKRTYYERRFGWTWPV